MRDFDKTVNELDRKLLNASLTGDIDGVLEALNMGANINAQDDENGMTCLHHAAGTNCVKIVKILIENNDLDPHIRDDAGRQAIDIAIDLGFTRPAEMLSIHDNCGGVNLAPAPTL